MVVMGEGFVERARGIRKGRWEWKRGIWSASGGDVCRGLRLRVGEGCGDKGAV